VSPTDPLNVVCPACGRSPVKFIVPSERGAYCLCQTCGHIWQQEGLLLSFRAGSGKRPKRRRSDPPPVVEEQQREIRRLKKRIAELETENSLLRASAIAFGELAERLNARVRRDRRNGLDRRHQQRTTPDRRVSKL
jgi:hypothetical protein